MEAIHYCLAHRLNLTVKGTAIEVTEIEHFKNLKKIYLKNCKMFIKWNP